MTFKTIFRCWNWRFRESPAGESIAKVSKTARDAVLHGLFESVHYVIPRGLDQTASVAQLAEQLICNQQVAGSTPAASSASCSSRPYVSGFNSPTRSTDSSLRRSNATYPPTRHPITRQRSRPTSEHTRGQPLRKHTAEAAAEHPKTGAPETGTQAHQPSMLAAQPARARGEFPERSKGSDCKSDGLLLRRFESCTPHCHVCPRSRLLDAADGSKRMTKPDAGVAQW